MLRFILLFIGLFLIWVLFFSNYKKAYKISISAISALVVACGLWWEMQRDALSTTLIDNEQIKICDLQITHSYRTNYDVTVCLNNQTKDAVAKRIALRYTALLCNPDCVVIDETDKERLITLPTLEQRILNDNIRFDNVDSTLTKTTPSTIQWRATVIEVKSTARD